MFFLGTNQEQFSFGEFYNNEPEMVSIGMGKIITEKDRQRGRRIKHLLESRDLDQKDLSIHLKKTHSTISKICSGSIRPTNAVLTSISEFFGVTTDFILNGTSAEHPSSAPMSPDQNVGRQPSERTLEHMADQKIIDRLLNQIDRLTEINEKQSARIDQILSQLADLQINQKNIPQNNNYKKASNGDQGE